MPVGMTPFEVSEARIAPTPAELAAPATPPAADETAELPLVRLPMILPSSLGRSLLENGHGNVADSLMVGEMLMPNMFMVTVTL